MYVAYMNAACSVGFEWLFLGLGTQNRNFQSYIPGFFRNLKTALLINSYVYFFVGGSVHVVWELLQLHQERICYLMMYRSSSLPVHRDPSHPLPAHRDTILVNLNSITSFGTRSRTEKCSESIRIFLTLPDPVFFFSAQDLA